MRLPRPLDHAQEGKKNEDAGSHEPQAVINSDIHHIPEASVATVPSTDVTYLNLGDLDVVDSLRLVSQLGSDHVRAVLEAQGIDDYWLPLSKQLVRRCFTDSSTEKAFLRKQEDLVDSIVSETTFSATGDVVLPSQPFHATFEDGEDAVSTIRVLGEGGTGLVEEVSFQTLETKVQCVRKKIGRPRQLKPQKQVMAAFIREINVMRQVDHPHCVRFVGSYTDVESVNILSLPIADTDLATLLDQPLTGDQWFTLYRGIGCLCNAL